MKVRRIQDSWYLLEIPTGLWLTHAHGKGLNGPPGWEFFFSYRVDQAELASEVDIDEPPGPFACASCNQLAPEKVADSALLLNAKMVDRGENAAEIDARPGALIHYDPRPKSWHVGA